MTKKNEPHPGNTVVSPYRPAKICTKYRQRDIRVQADQLRWVINQHCPEGDDRDELHKWVTLVEEGACVLTAAWRKNEEGGD